MDKADSTPCIDLPSQTSHLSMPSKPCNQQFRGRTYKNNNSWQRNTKVCFTILIGAT
ncbi:hypothetical protein FH972_010756 [Carpinus fangiana]|uniref:Uncharacterized protein n=1 Tax=Carpinus fangiana TaxID=176857 RepID=A0A660KSD5_9ROSI|nr:hypothetical protein FH972_010756 [Carpinus fangiana]